MALTAALALIAIQAAPLGATIRAPKDHFDPRSGEYGLNYEFGAPFDRRKPTVFVIADGQQFFVRKGRGPIIQKSFGAGFNVVAIVGRGDAPDLAVAVKDKKGTVDWVKAWRLYKSDQWIEDIDAVRRRLLGKDGKPMLYGASGGAMLVHQYLARHGEHVRRAFTAAAAMPFIEGELGLEPTTFWNQIDPSLHDEVRQVLRDHAADRVDLVTTFQRQHFFVSAGELPQARARLIRALASGDAAAYEKAKEEYQVNGIRKLEASDTGIPIRVREYEFLSALGRITPPPAEELDAEYEAEYWAGYPLIRLAREGKIGRPAMDFRRLHRLDTEVLIQAGIHDEAVDYRSSISLAARYPNGRIVLLDDNHMFSSAQSAGIKNKLQNAFLSGGFGSPQYRSALNAVARLKPKPGS